MLSIWFYGSSGREFTPLTALLFFLTLVILPWIWQHESNRNARLGASPMDETDECFWRNVAWVMVPLLIGFALLAKKLNWFTSWTQW
jgi:hypothetical protein